MPHERNGARSRAGFRMLAIWLLCLVSLPASAGTPPLDEPIAPLLPIAGLDPQRAALGARLFRDVRLSRDDTVSCATCHVLTRGGADGLARSRGIGGAEGNVNAPTVFNSAFNFAQFWDGRTETLEEQAAGPIHNPLEMASDWQQVIAKLARDRELVSQFAAGYPDGLTPANVAHAIATFERSLTTTNAPFDRFLQGDREAISPAARNGYQLFKSYGCAACHQGATVGGNMFQAMGVMGDYFADRGRRTPADLGRYNITREPRDRGVFKVPSLRLAVLTAPYFHDGSAATLDRAIDIMARYQLGRSIPPAQRREIAEFLRTLAGEHPELTR